MPSCGNHIWFRYMPPGIRLSPGLLAKASRESGAPASAFSQIQRLHFHEGGFDAVLARASEMIAD